ncbi:MAG: malonyl-CoA O-methyltransferase [Cellvibrionaceae bacterium]|jgi:malonyl-CoA O-methyltransferase
MTNKVKVAGCFTRSATSYDKAAAFQRRVGEQLLDDLVAINIEAKRCLDLGCGTGYFHERLQEALGVGDYLGIDIAQGMLSFCRQRHSLTQLICADAEQLPLMENCQVFIYSNLALQWCENLTQLLSELNRVLQPGGILAFTTLGPQTLHELRQAWQSVDNLMHVNRFIPQGDWEAAIAKQNFHIVSQRKNIEVLYYPVMANILKELKNLGANHVKEGRRKTLTGRGHWQKLQQGYESFRRGDDYPASYEVYSWILRKGV